MQSAQRVVQPLGLGVLGSWPPNPSYLPLRPNSSWLKPEGSSRCCKKVHMEKESQVADGHQARLHLDARPNALRVDPGVTRVCCGNLIEPRLAEIRCPNDPTLFIAVWRCPICGRITR